MLAIVAIINSLVSQNHSDVWKCDMHWPLKSFEIVKLVYNKQVGAQGGAHS
jgi:hypothetical protein